MSSKKPKNISQSIKLICLLTHDCVCEDEKVFLMPVLKATMANGNSILRCKAGELTSSVGEEAAAGKISNLFADCLLVLLHLVFLLYHSTSTAIYQTTFIITVLVGGVRARQLS